MFDGLTDAAELLGDLLDTSSGLNSGNSPAAGPTAVGAGGSGSGGPPGDGPGSPPDDPNRRRRRRRRDRDRDPRDDLKDLHDPILEDNLEELTELGRDLTNDGPSSRKRLREHARDLLTKRLRPRTPGIPVEQFLTEEAVEAQRQLAITINEVRHRDAHLPTSEFDLNAYTDGRKGDPFAPMGDPDPGDPAADDEPDDRSGSGRPWEPEFTDQDAQDTWDDIETRRQIEEQQRKDERERWGR